MGDNMSKRLKLISGTDAEMEERSFSNPYPDWDQGVLTSNSGADVDCNDTLDSEGKVSTYFQKKVQSKIKDLLQQMEEGLKTADPHDFSTYTGWTGLSLTTLKM
ncbi:lanC-like protein 2 [Neolamprologus brichardi]|uniref:lanC-like protein 2 n=1 Tax=Neolamprologus brichardi TaxID=32507 RepID=UPI0003EC4B2C|nr:lanC-like protein 2 [Neolamprologus brichardi]